MTYESACVDKDLDRGDDVTYRLTVMEPKTGSKPNPPKIDLAGSFIIFEMKKQPKTYRLKPTDPVVVRKTSDNLNEIEILDEIGQCLIKLVSSDTEFLQPGTYAYSVRVTTGAGRTRTVTKGRIFLKGAATAAENFTP
jgi:hypothetical protein